MKRYYALSMGRVQDPTLAFVVDKEFEIIKHVPVPYWTIIGNFKKDGGMVNAYYQLQKVNSFSKFTSVTNACKDQDGRVTEINTKKTVIKSSTPFNLGDLQKEVYRVFQFSPTPTLAIDENLYLPALISYPRTSSQKIPVSINYKKIILDLSKIKLELCHINSRSNTNNSYMDIIMRLLSKEILSPNDGIGIDSAHPAIYPTGPQPKSKL